MPRRELRVETLACASCGAPLPMPSGHAIECTYCGRALVVHGHETELETDRGDRTVADDLLTGAHPGRVGVGRRMSTTEMSGRDWKCWERGVWPTAANASSAYGGGWSASAIVGAPSVYPRCGDISGAWAPRSSKSAVEWIEARYPGGAPEIDTIRVFETNAAGCTFAVTVGAGPNEEVVYRGEAERKYGAHVLEVKLPEPRKVDRVRAWVRNDVGRSWSEIDTIGLVATAPVPPSMRRRAKNPYRRLVATLAVLLLLPASWLVVERVLKPEPHVLPPRPTTVVAGAQWLTWHIGAPGLERRGVVWASRVVDRSSQYRDSDYAASQALGAPDVLPRYCDCTAAWASEHPDLGPEWITVGFPRPVHAGSIVVVETFNPGAVIRIDDVTDAAAPTLLWEGTSTRANGSRVMSLDLAEPRSISAVRIVIDARRVGGWNEIDAIGLLPAGGG